MLRRSMSGNTGLNTLAQTSGGMIRRNDSSGKLYMNPNGGWEIFKSLQIYYNIC